VYARTHVHAYVTYSADLIDFIDKSMLKAELLSLAPRETNVASLLSEFVELCRITDSFRLARRSYTTPSITLITPSSMGLIEQSFGTHDPQCYDHRHNEAELDR